MLMFIIQQQQQMAAAQNLTMMDTMKSIRMLRLFKFDLVPLLTADDLSALFATSLFTVSFH